MGSHTISALERLDVVESGRRRRWREEEKLRIVLESLSGPRLVSATARRHNISRSLLMTWRRAFRFEQAATAASAPGFVPAVIVPEPLVPPRLEAQASKPRREGRIEIVLGCGRRVIVEEDIAPEALSRVLAVVERR